MKAPRKGVCRVCGETVWPGQHVRIMPVAYLDSPLVRMRHVGCDPGVRRVGPSVPGVKPLPREDDAA